MWSATQIPHIAAVRAGRDDRRARVEDPGDRARRRRRLRRQAPDHARRSGSPGRSARRLGKPVKYTETRSRVAGGRPPRPRPVAEAHPGGRRRTARSPASRSTCSPTSAPTSRIVGGGVPVLGAFMFNAIYKFPAYQFSVPDGAHQQDLDRRLPRRRPARGDVRHRAADGRARRRGRRGPARDPREELDQARGVPVHHGGRAGVRLRQLRGRHRQGQGDVRVRRAAGRAEAAPRRPATRSSSASASRRSPRCAASRPSRVLGVARLRRRRLGARERADAGRPARSRSSPAPRAHGQGHETAFSQIVADRLGVAFEDVEVLHGDTQVAAQGPRHLRLAVAGRRRRGAGPGRRQGDREGQADRGAPARGVGRRPRVRRRPVLGPGHRPGHGDRRGRARRSFAAHNLPDGVEPSLDSDATYDPVNFTFPHGTHLCAMEVDTETGGGEDAQVRLRATTSATSSTR